MSKTTQKRKRRRLSKLIKSTKIPKSRIPTAPPSKAFKSIKDYDRSKNKQLEKIESDE
jgi:hypothetical protein